MSRRKTNDTRYELSQHRTSDMRYGMSQKRTRSMRNGMSQKRTCATKYGMSQKRTSAKRHRMSQQRTSATRYGISQQKPSDTRYRMSQKRTRYTRYRMSQQRTSDTRYGMSQRRQSYTRYVLTQREKIYTRFSFLLKFILVERINTQTHVALVLLFSYGIFYFLLVVSIKKTSFEHFKNQQMKSKQYVVHMFEGTRSLLPTPHVTEHEPQFVNIHRQRPFSATSFRLHVELSPPHTPQTSCRSLECRIWSQPTCQNIRNIVF